MKCKAITLLAGMLVSANALAQLKTNEQSLRIWDMSRAMLVKGSESPDGAYALYETFRIHVPTASSIIIAPVDKSRALGKVDSLTNWSTDEPHTKILEQWWAPDSKIVATHCKIPRNSKVSFMGKTDSGFGEFEVPDLIKLMGLEPTELRSSGQSVIQWHSNTSASVQVRARLKTGRTERKTYVLSFDFSSGKASVVR